MNKNQKWVVSAVFLAAAATTSFATDIEDLYRSSSSSSSDEAGYDACVNEHLYKSAHLTQVKELKAEATAKMTEEAPKSATGFLSVIQSGLSSAWNAVKSWFSFSWAN